MAEDDVKKAIDNLFGTFGTLGKILGQFTKPPETKEEPKKDVGFKPNVEQPKEEGDTKDKLDKLEERIKKLEEAAANILKFIKR
jgi:hypothetical protein